MAQELAAGPVTLLQLLQSEREYHSPLFQRQYVWSDSQIAALWKDIDEILDESESSKFLGAIVLETRRAGLAFEPTSYWIIDGQQRLTTLYLILLCVAQLAERHDSHELFEGTTRQYLFNQGGRFKNTPKLLPTLRDYRQFTDVLKAFVSFEPKLPTQFGEESGRLQKATRLLMTKVTERCRPDGKFELEKAKRLLSVVLENLKFVQILLGESQDPHQVFHSLNTGGVPLQNKDLIRNEVFHRLADEPEEADRIHANKWAPFEVELGERLDSYFFPFTLIHKPNTTKSKVFSILRERWKSKNPGEIIDDLRVFVPAYNAFSDSNPDSRNGLGLGEAAASQISCLYRMRIPTSMYPYMMRLVQECRSNNVDEKTCSDCMLICESFLVRRALNGVEPTGLHAVFKDMWSHAGADPALIIKTIDETATVAFPDDDEFRESIKNKPLYQRKLAQYVIIEFERSLIGGDPVPDIIPTLDHIMPQNLDKAWKDVVDDKDHKRLKDTWANLVPLSTQANSEKARNSWPQVKEFFRTETVFKTTKRLAEEHDSWDAQAIVKRSEQLAKWALLRWPKNVPRQGTLPLLQSKVAKYNA